MLAVGSALREREQVARVLQQQRALPSEARLPLGFPSVRPRASRRLTLAAPRAAHVLQAQCAMKSLAERVVVITGGSAGLGRATARAFAERGARVAVLARGEERLAETVRELEELGRPCLGLAVDVADARAVEEAAEQIEWKLGPIEIWVNNAMVTVFAPVDQIAAEEFQRVTAVTYLGAVNGTLAALKRMKRHGRGVIVQVGSALAYRAIPLQSAYCASKHALRGFTDSLRCELLHEQSPIHLTMVQMPALNTPQFDWGLSRMPQRPQPVPPIFQPEVGAEAIVWAATHRKRELYVSSSSLKTIVFNKLFPALGDRLAASLAWDGQLTCEPQPRGAPSNLFEPVAKKCASHGRFDAKSLAHSPELWLATHRGWLSAALLTLVASTYVTHRMLHAR